MNSQSKISVHNTPFIKKNCALFSKAHNKQLKFLRELPIKLSTHKSKHIIKESSIMNNLLIKHKIWVGFAILLSILMINAIISTNNLLKTKNTVSSVVETSQPVVLAAHKFNGYLGQASSALVNYMLTKKSAHREAYLNAQQEAITTLSELSDTVKRKQSAEIQHIVDGLKTQLGQFRSFEEQMLILATDRLENEPAVKFAAENINPLSISILGNLTSMILSEEEEDLSAERVIWLNFMHDFRYSFAKLMTALRLYLNDPSPAVKQNLQNSFDLIAEYSTKIDAYEDIYSFEQEDAVILLKEDISSVSENMKTMMEISESKKHKMDIYLLNQDIYPLLKQMQNDIDTLVAYETRIMEDNNNELLRTVDTGIKLQLILAGLGLILGIVVAFIISKTITVPLNKTVIALQQAAKGDGDLSRRLEITSKDELGELSQAFNLFSEKLQSILQEVSSCSTQLIQSAEQMNQVVASTESDIYAQNDHIDQISSAIDSMVHKIQEVANHTSQAASLAEQTNQNSIKGKSVVNQSLNSSNEVAQSVDQAATVINELESDVSTISGVVEVIRGIAEQTNLLALNAAIEAARAGEQGRGFAVVADEVRTLASRTQDSTDEIQKMIVKLQTGSQQAVETMNNGKHKANDGLNLAQQAGDSLEEISSAVEGMLSMNREIASSTESQGQTALQVNSSVATISQLATQTASSSTIMAETGNKVNELALQLQHLMKQFKV